MTENPKLKHYTPKEGVTAEPAYTDRCYRCPYCGEDTDIQDSEQYNLFSMHGSESERTEVECGDCEQIFYVEETVSRTFTSFKAEA